MEINKKNRTELKSYFLANNVPTESNFADFIDANLNQAEDSIAKTAGNPVSIQAEGGEQSPQKLLNFYKEFADQGPTWSLEQNPFLIPNDPSTNRPGFNLADSNNRTRLFVRQSDRGEIGLGTLEPGAKLHIANTSSPSWTYNVLKDDLSLELGKDGAGDVGSIKLNSYNPGQFVFLRPSDGNYHVDSSTGQYYFNWDSDVRGGNSGVIRLGNYAGHATVTLNSHGTSWLNGGHVGIGTDAPLAKLQVVGGAIMPQPGNGPNAGITFPNDPGGGGSDSAWLRYYSRGGEAMTLELGISNDPDDNIALMTAGNVGIGTNTPTAKLELYGIHLNGTAGRNIFRDSELPAGGGLRVGAVWGKRGIFAEEGPVVVGGVGGVHLQDNHAFLSNAGKFGLSTLNPATTLHVATGTDSAAATPNSGYVIVGSSTGTHISIDDNEIMAKSSATQAGTLHLNMEGGTIFMGGMASAPGFKFDGNRTSHIEADGSLYRTNGQAYLTVDDHLFFRRMGGATQIHFDARGSGSLGIGVGEADMAAPLVVRKASGSAKMDIVQFGDGMGYAHIGAGSNFFGFSDQNQVNRLVIRQNSGNVGIGVDDPGISKLDVRGRTDIVQPGAPAKFNGMLAATNAGSRAQVVLSSHYSDLVIASGQNNNTHGSTLTFATFNPGNTAQYRKFVLNQGNWGSRKHMLSFAYMDGDGVTNPHSPVHPTHNVMVMDGIHKRVGIQTDNPAAPMDINGDGGAGRVQLIVRQTAGSTASKGHGIGFVHGASDDWLGKIGHLGLKNDWGFDIWTDQTNPMRFWIGAAEKMTLTNSGHLGLNAPSPAGPLHIETGGSGSWGKFVVTNTQEWGDTNGHYVTIGAGGASGIMLSAPHVTWRDNRASIRYGRSGGTAAGHYWDVGVRPNNAFSFAKNGDSDHKLFLDTNGNMSLGTTNSEGGKLHVEGLVNVHRGPRAVFKGLHNDAYRAQLVLSSQYSDLVIGSSEANDNHGSTLTFATYNPSNSNDYRKWVINQGNWGTRKHFLEFGYMDGAHPNPHTMIGDGRSTLTLDGVHKRVGIGRRSPTHSLDVHGGTIQHKIHFHGTGGDSGQGHDHYAIYQESGPWNFPYPDLVINYHTGIKLGAEHGYNGIRMYLKSDAGVDANLGFAVGNREWAVRSYVDMHVNGTFYEHMDVIQCHGRGDWGSANHPIMLYFKNKLAGQPAGTMVRATQDHPSWRGHYWYGWKDIDGRTRVHHNHHNTGNWIW